MKNHHYLATLTAGALALVSSVDARAQGSYFESYGGINLVQGTDITAVGVGTVEAKFNPGVRLDLGAGYRFNDKFSAGFELGYTYNAVDTLGGMDISDFGVDMDYHQIPFLAVVRYDFHNSSRFTPYIGAGAGGLFSLFNTSLGGASETEAAAAFAYQATAGVTYRVGENMRVGLGYKLLGTSDQSFGDGSVELDSTVNHSFGLKLDFSF